MQKKEQLPKLASREMLDEKRQMSHAVSIPMEVIKADEAFSNVAIDQMINDLFEAGFQETCSEMQEMQEEYLSELKKQSDEQLRIVELETELNDVKAAFEYLIYKDRPKLVEMKHLMDKHDKVAIIHQDKVVILHVSRVDYDLDRDSLYVYFHERMTYERKATGFTTIDVIQEFKFTHVKATSKEYDRETHPHTAKTLLDAYRHLFYVTEDVDVVALTEESFENFREDSNLKELWEELKSYLQG